MILALSLLAVSIACYSIRELQSHGKLRWQDDATGFWGEESWTRKYKMEKYFTIPAKVNWYTKLFKIKYKERWPTSTWLTVNFTDGYHLLQSLSFLSMAGSISLLTGINFLIIWGLILLVHFLTYKLLSK